MYDKGGEEHYNIISALHKSIRNGDADAAVYWLARMLEGGEDPMYIARRLVRAASEDIGNADPQALVFAVAVQQTVHFIGMPEGGVALAQLVTYLAASPKSNAAYRGYGEAVREVRQGDNPGVPLHIRNAPTRLMKDLGYGRGYQYAHDFQDQTASMECLPESLAGRRFYEPKEVGFERGDSGAVGEDAEGKGGSEDRTFGLPPRTPDVQAGRMLSTRSGEKRALGPRTARTIDSQPSQWSPLL
jgi:putative ATPase